MELELNKLLVPVSETTPSGEDMEYDQTYIALDSLATGVPSAEMGDSVIEEVEPDFRKLQADCLQLWNQTRDLRLACYLSISGLALHGLKGFADGLETVHYLLNEQWDSFWPQLDPDDDNDALERLNILMMLSPAVGAYDDPIHFLPLFRNTRLVPVGPSYTLRELMISENELEAANTTVDSALLNAEMTAVPLEIISEQAKQLERINTLLEECSKLFDEKAVNYTLTFTTLNNELKRLTRFYNKYLQATPQATPEEAVSTENAAPGAVAANTPRPVNIQTIQAQNRSEALLLLRKGCEYFQNAEPSSPIPFLINRALRMADMNFMELLSELTPDAVDRGRDILGVIQSDNSDN